MPGQYYTPALEDLFVGYECERYSTDGFSKFTIKNLYDLQMLGEQLRRYDSMRNPDILAQFTNPRFISETAFIHEVRTPFLTREAIEGDGYKFIGNVADQLQKVTDPANMRFFRGLDQADLFLGEASIIAHTQFRTVVMNTLTDELFVGRIPSINEFRKVGVKHKETVSAQ